MFPCTSVQISAFCKNSKAVKHSKSLTQYEYLVKTIAGSHRTEYQRKKSIHCTYVLQLSCSTYTFHNINNMYFNSHTSYGNLRIINKDKR